jgi:anaerobic selenocysteine-containing dehydrogenase
MTAGLVQSKRSYCRVCTTQCGIVIDVDEDRIVKIRGDRDHPLTKGYTCPKGRSIGLWHHHEDGITSPMMRKNGELAVVGWDECLDDVAAKLKRTIEAHGPDAVGFYFGSGLGMDASGYRMADTFYRNLGTPPRFSPTSIDGTAKIMVAGLVGGFPGLNPKADYATVEMLLYVGSNPMVSHGHNTGMFNPAAMIRGTSRRGDVWTIDPLATETAKFSTRHLAPYPGKDYAILAWLTREVLNGGPLNPAQPVTGIAELRAALADFDRRTAATIAGIAEADLDDLLAAIRRHGKLVVETGTGVTMSKSANLTHWFGWVLMILTGAMNREGGAWFHPGFMNQYDRSELPEMETLTAGPPTMPGVTGLIGEWPCAALPREIAAGNIRAFVNLGGSLLRSFPDVNVLRPALGKLDLLVTFENFMNETVPLSSHVLPGKGQVERPEISFWDTMSTRVSMQHAPAIVPARGERRSNWWIISQLMRRMGMPVSDDVPLDDREPGADDRMLASLITESARCGFEELAATGYVERPREFPAPWLDAHVERIGGWRLAPQELLDFWEVISAADIADLDKPRPRLSFISRRQRRKINGSLSFLGSPTDIILNPADAAAFGIKHGDNVRVRTDRGEIVLSANVDPAIRPGVASIPHGHESANVNYLTNTNLVDPLGGQVLYTGIPIEVEAVSQ